MILGLYRTTPLILFLQAFYNPTLIFSFVLFEQSIYFSPSINLIPYPKNIYFSQSYSKIVLFLVSIFGFAGFDTTKVQTPAGNAGVISHTQPISRKVFFSLT